MKAREDLSKVIIVGDGAVGSTYAHALITQNIADEIGIIDINREKVEGDALDLMHALPYSNVPSKIVYAADYSDAADADIVTITANAPQAQFGKTLDRLVLLKNNIKMIKEITEKIMASGFDGIFLIASNPVDILTKVVQQVSGLPKGRVIGSGTSIDTARMRRIVADAIDIDPKNVHGYVLGEHGSSSFTAWSNVYVSTLPIVEWIGKNPQYQYPSFEEMDQTIRDIGFDIFKKKGATFYGIAAVLARITQAILRNEKTIIPVSAYLNGEYGVKDLYIGVPAIIGRSGVRELVNLYLNDDELKAFQNSAKVLEENFLSIKDEL